MRELIKKIYLQTDWARHIIHPLLRLRNSIFSEKYLLKKRFERILGYKLDLVNPKTFNEKIQWLKLYDRGPLHTICADKYTVREYIKKVIGEEYLIPLVLETQNPYELNSDNLPNYPFIIKANHDSGGGTIVRNKKEINWVKLYEELNARIKTNYNIFAKGEWQYQNIKPRIIVEKLLIDENGKIPNDYKLHCFNGKLKFTQVDQDRQTNHTRNLYDENWNFISCAWEYPIGHKEPKPTLYNKMKEISETLAKDFIYLRIDLYIVSDRIYFGELTFHPGSGYDKFDPDIWDYNFGKMLTIPV